MLSETFHALLEDGALCDSRVILFEIFQFLKLLWDLLVVCSRLQGLCGTRALCELHVFHLSFEAFAVAVGYLLPVSIRGLT